MSEETKNMSQGQSVPTASSVPPVAASAHPAPPVKVPLVQAASAPSISHAAGETHTKTPADPFRADKAAALVMAARLAQRRGNKPEARAKLKEAFAIDPTDCGALEVLGDIFLEEAEQEKAIAVFERGLKYHPSHRVFEEKIALAHLDLAEMERDKIQRELLMTQGDTESWRDRKPTRAFGLSLLLPGAGHYYAEEHVRGAWFTGIWILAFIAWYLPLNAGFGYLRAMNTGGGVVRVTMSNALNQLHPFWLIWFYLFALVFVVTYLAAAYDAWRTVEQANIARRKFLGLQ